MGRPEAGLSDRGDWFMMRRPPSTVQPIGGRDMVSFMLRHLDLDRLEPGERPAAALALRRWEALAPHERVSSLFSPTPRLQWEALARLQQLGALRRWCRSPDGDWARASWSQPERRTTQGGPSRPARRSPAQRRGALASLLSGALQVAVLEHFGLGGRSLTQLRRSLHSATLAVASVADARELLRPGWPALVPSVAGPTALLVSRGPLAQDLLRIGRWARDWDRWEARPLAPGRNRGRWSRQPQARPRPQPRVWIKAVSQPGGGVLQGEAIERWLRQHEQAVWRLLSVLVARAEQLEGAPPTDAAG